MRVVLAILDAMPHRYVTPELTPTLCEQAALGGRAPNGAESLTVSVTYSNHAAFITGVHPSTTGLWGNRGWVEGEGFRKTYEIGPEAPTVFDACAAADRRSVAVVGDHKLIVTMGGGVADQSWPPAGELDPYIPLDAYGYPQDRAVVDAAAGLDLDADFVLLHLNEPDTTMHLHGPDSDEAIAQYRRSDAAYGQLLALLEPDWDNTVLLTISDHDQETIDCDECIDLRPWLNDRGIDASVSGEGTAAVVKGAAARELTAVTELAGVEGIEAMADDVTYVWAEPGWMFGKGAPQAKGNHGSPRCRTQLAIVSGGHARVAEVATRVTNPGRRPTSLTWAPLITELLGV